MARIKIKLRAVIIRELLPSDENENHFQEKTSRQTNASVKLSLKKKEQTGYSVEKIRVDDS